MHTLCIFIYICTDVPAHPYMYIYIYAVIHKDMHAKHKCTHTPTTTNNPYIYIDTHRQTYATEEMQPAISEMQPRFMISVLFVLKRCNYGQTIAIFSSSHGDSFTVNERFKHHDVCRAPTCISRGSGETPDAQSGYSMARLQVMRNCGIVNELSSSSVEQFPGQKKTHTP